VVELVGARNIIAKTLGRGNPFNTVRATLNGLSQLRDPHEVMHLRRMVREEEIQPQVQVG
jgi:small subunit ribosomal protein S5